MIQYYHTVSWGLILFASWWWVTLARGVPLFGRFKLADTAMSEGLIDTRYVFCLLRGVPRRKTSDSWRKNVYKGGALLCVALYFVLQITFMMLTQSCMGMGALSLGVCVINSVC